MTLLGAHFATASGQDGPWPKLLERFKRGKFGAAKIMIPPGFATEPRHVTDLIDAGAKEVILRTEDDDYTPQRVRSELVGRGFYDVIINNPHIQFVLEVGNEQNLAGMDPWQGRFWQLRTRYDLRSLDRPNLKWVASMPTKLEQVKVYMNRTVENFVSGHVNLTDMYDGIGVHLYGHYHVDDAHDADWVKIFDYLRSTTNTPLYVTEFGINHPLDSVEKGNRYLDWFAGLDPARVPSAYIFWLGEGQRYPQYQIDNVMADVLARRIKDENGPPEMTLHEALEYVQREFKRFHPEFEPVRIKP